MSDDERRPRRPIMTARPESLPDSVADRLRAIADEHPDAEVEFSGAGYPPEAIHVLAGMEPRPQGVTIGTSAEHWWASVDGLAAEPVGLWRDAGAEQDPPQPWGAQRLGCEGLLWPDRVRLVARAIPPGGRIALRDEDLTDEEMAGILAFQPAGPAYSLDDIPDDGPRHAVEDGPGSSDRVALAVRVLVGTERSTVIVANPVTQVPIERQVVQHGGEADAAAAAVSASIRGLLGR